ncbi:hypothetical protein [Rhodopirellula bahusiensis]|uniref:hypothetical protein n=1 Tax=Rhodopirellula bahusiensis TaxID=2014065 RepID=UPI0032663112
MAQFQVPFAEVQMRPLIVVFILLLPLCTVPACSSNAQEESPAQAPETLVDARQGFNTKIVRQDEGSVLPEVPTESDFDLVRYKSAVGPLAAYVTKDPGDRAIAPHWVICDSE